MEPCLVCKKQITTVDAVMWGGDVLCKLCAYGKMSDQAARIAELEALLSPEGTIHKRVLRLVEVARRMGFERAGEAAWNQAGDIEESAVESLERDVEDGYWDEPIAYRMGLYLHETVYAYRHYDEDSDEYSVFVLDDQAEAEKRVARKDGA